MIAFSRSGLLVTRESKDDFQASGVEASFPRHLPTKRANTKYMIDKHVRFCPSTHHPKTQSTNTHPYPHFFTTSQSVISRKINSLREETSTICMYHDVFHLISYVFQHLPKYMQPKATRPQVRTHARRYRPTRGIFLALPSQVSVYLSIDL